MLLVLTEIVLAVSLRENYVTVLTKIVLIMGSYENDIILIKTYPKKKKKKR